MDTTSFVFGPQPPEKASSRWFKNVSLLWKVAGAVALSLAVCLFILWFSSRETFVGVRLHIEKNAQEFCQRGSDVMLGVMHGLLKAHVEEVGRSVQAIESTWKSTQVSPLSDTMKEQIQHFSDNLSFLAVLDDQRVPIATYIVSKRGVEKSIHRVSGSKKKIANTDIFRWARKGQPQTGPIALNSATVASLGLTKQAQINGQSRDCLALVNLRFSSIGTKSYFLFGGYVLNNSREFISEVQKVVYNVRRWDVSHEEANEAVMSVGLGTTCVVSSKPQLSPLGSQLPLPRDDISSANKMALWRGEIKLAKKRFISTLTPIISIKDEEIGFLSVAVDLENFMVPHNRALSELRQEYRSNMGLAILVALAVSLLVGFLAARLIIWPLALLTQFTSEVAAGRLNVNVTLDGHDEIGALASSFRNMVKNLRALTRRIDDATVQLGEAARQLSTNLTAQSATSAQQAVAVKGTTVTLEELAAASRQIADSALAVVKAAAKTLESAKRGRDSSQATIDQMARIQQANEDDLDRIAALGNRIARIDEIMALINTIADQTKLIAFNAAIEAAAAGDAGRRFSVVSEEIRRLAENVLDRALEIRTSISDVQEATEALVASRREGSSIVQDGVEVTEQTSQDLSEILEDTNSVLQDSKQISMSTQQQRAATEQSLGAIKEIEEGVSELVDGTKQTKEVVTRLSSLAQMLRESVERFELKGGDEEVSL